MTITTQMKQWSDDFGEQYTDRNPQTLEQMEALYQRQFGTTRRVLNEMCLDGVDRDSRILEVGCNIGNQLLCLQQMGFSQLYGIELQQYAVSIARTHTKQINIIQGSAFDIPFKDQFFDLVFTSGVLIHIAPSDLDHVLSEIFRCSRQYVWGFEYYAAKIQSIPYRGQNDLLWKADYAQEYLGRFSDLRLVTQHRVAYLDNNQEDNMFLLTRAGHS